MSVLKDKCIKGLDLPEFTEEQKNFSKESMYEGSKYSRIEMDAQLNLILSRASDIFELLGKVEKCLIDQDISKAQREMSSLKSDIYLFEGTINNIRRFRSGKGHNW